MNIRIFIFGLFYKIVEFLFFKIDIIWNENVILKF